MSTGICDTLLATSQHIIIVVQISYANATMHALSCCAVKYRVARTYNDKWRMRIVCSVRVESTLLGFGLENGI